MSYERKSLILIDQVLSFVIFGSKNTRSSSFKVYDGLLINMTSQRYQLFKLKGCDCVRCGIKGQYFAIERTPPISPDMPAGWHLNLYALDSANNEVMMTKDHIIPKSRGGKNNLDNYQPMCIICNAMKSNNF